MTILVEAADTSKKSGGVTLPANPIDYPIVFTQNVEEPKEGTWTTVGIFSALQWLLPVFQLAGWIPKNINSEHKNSEEREKKGEHNNGPGGAAANEEDVPAEIEDAKKLLPHFESFFAMESKVIPNGALLYTVQAFRIPTPRGPRSITRALVEAPGKYFSPLQEEKGGGHFLCCYEEQRLLRCFTYVQLDQLRFAWVAVKELMEEHKAVQRTDGALTGLARRDIKKNNSNCDETATKVVDRACGAATVTATTAATPAAPAILPSQMVVRPAVGGNVITGPTADARKTREELREKKYLSDLLREECAARWPHTPAHKSVVFVVEERQMEAVGGRKGRKGPRMYLATVEMPLLNKKGGLASFKGTQWCTTRKDAENAAAEVALRALRSMKL